MEPFPSGKRWFVGDGDLLGAAERIASRGHAGALVRVHAREHVDGASTVRAAWLSMLEALPEGAVAARTGWAHFEAVVDGDEGVVGPIGAAVLRRLVHVVGITPRWAVTLVALRAGRVDRAFVCDPGYDLARLSPCALAWVEPYAGDDWQESQRYPTVRPLDATSGRAGG